MVIDEKLSILANSAKYDVSCSSSGSRAQRPGRLGAVSSGGICHSWSADGRCISLLKILQTNRCIYDCAYCVNRRSNDVPRALFTPEELAALTVRFYRRNYIEGLFLSSAVAVSPDYTMELIVRTLRLLRGTYRFGGYIHCKLIPGAAAGLIQEAGMLADRVSVNIELPTRKSLALLAPQKIPEAILTPMQRVSTAIAVARQERRSSRRAPLFAPGGQSTQLIIGATPESDAQILRLSNWLYSAMRLKRVYYSAYVPVNKQAGLPALNAPPLLREHRLYQADWLMRFYGFGADELFDAAHQNLETDIDPKVGWACRHPEYFPVEINTAEEAALLRVPGLGVRSVQKILQLRRVKRVQQEDLLKLRSVWKRAQYFITVNGKYYGRVPPAGAQALAALSPPPVRERTLFDPIGLPADEAGSVITGEL
ncbi:MAG: putative DNA modification/repair radical SAM protein [Candidatus Omnitrophica bacterium]|nr:putative DNA modification/repair radical SAM protein [Candidatus Omnitrophota bacterium]